MADNSIRLAVAEAKAGNKTEARKIASRILRTDPDNIRAWIVMAQVVNDRDKAIDCLKNVLRLDPEHPWARLHLNRLTGAGSPPPPSSSAATAVHPAAPAPSAPRDLSSLDDLFAQPSTSYRDDTDTTVEELSLDDLDFGEVIRPAGLDNTASDLDPFAASPQWTQPGTDSGGQYTYDQVRGELEREVAAPKKRRRVPCLLLIVVFLLFLVLTFAAGAFFLRDYLPF